MAHYAEYKFKGGNFTKDGHAMFTEDVVRDLNRKSVLEEERTKNRKELDRRWNLLGDVVNELELSEKALEKHGPMGTEPSAMVREVLDQKDLIIRALQQGFVPIPTNSEEPTK